MSTDRSSLRSLDVELEERAELLSDAARSLPHLTAEEREQARARALAFLREEVADHLAMDERLLYPRVAERLADPFAPAAMRYDHRAIRWWIDQIAQTDIADVDQLQRLLYGVHAVIRVHLSKEEDLYVGALDSEDWPAGR